MLLKNVSLKPYLLFLVYTDKSRRQGCSFVSMNVAQKFRNLTEWHLADRGKGKKSKWHQSGPFNSGLQKQTNPSDVQQLSKQNICCNNRVSYMCTYVFVCLFFLTVEGKGSCLLRESVFSLPSPSLITAVLAADAQ